MTKIATHHDHLVFKKDIDSITFTSANLFYMYTTFSSNVHNYSQRLPTLIKTIKSTFINQRLIR